MPVPITTQISEHAAEALRQRAERERRSLSDVTAEAVEEAIRMREFPGILFVDGPAGDRKSKVQGGLDTWEYVFIARGYDGDVARTAEHLRATERQVQLALDYYRAYPQEIDDRFRRMEEIERDPSRFFPHLRVYSR